MKKLQNCLLGIAAAVLISSCGVGHAYITNQNQNSTQVHLSGNNYKIVDRVSGTSEVDYYLMLIGGLNKRRLYENAYSKMMESAELTGSQALVNFTTEEHLGGVPPFYVKRTITVSAQVVEFTGQ